MSLSGISPNSTVGSTDHLQNLHLSGCNSINEPISKRRKLIILLRRLSTLEDEFTDLKRHIERIINSDG